MKINNFWGELTDVSAKKEALLCAGVSTRKPTFNPESRSFLQSKSSLWEMIFSGLLFPSRRWAQPAGTVAAIHHRIALFDKQGNITQVVSQSDIVRFIFSQTSSIRDSLAIKVVDIPGVLPISVLHLLRNLDCFPFTF